MSKNLFMILLGCKPPGRFTEQHDVFFGVAASVPELKSEMENFWPEALGELHIDAWKLITQVQGYQISVGPRRDAPEQTKRLFFVNLGGYRENDFEEYHYKQLIVADSLEQAAELAKQTQFFSDHISPHIDDKYGLDVDDIFDVEEILSPLIRERYCLTITLTQDSSLDPLHIGYLKFSEL